MYVMVNPVNLIDQDGLTKTTVIDKGSYTFKLFPGDTMHGGEHWHIYDRKTGKLLGRITPTGEVITGSVPNKSLKLFVKTMKIGGVVFAIIIELAFPTEANEGSDIIPCH